MFRSVGSQSGVSLGGSALFKEQKSWSLLSKKSVMDPTKEVSEDHRRISVFMSLDQAAALHLSGLYGRVAQRKPLLSAGHMKACMKFAKKTPEGLQDGEK